MPSTTYYWDEIDDNVCCEEDENGEITASYTHEAGLYGEVIAQKRGEEIRYYNFDGEENTSELVDENENVTDTYEYSAFGEEVARTGTTVNPFGYKGALGYYSNGETNDVYVRARTYRPTIGRWQSRDPLTSWVIQLLQDDTWWQSGWEADPVIQHPKHVVSYVYCGNNPAIVVDHSGLLWVKPVGHALNLLCGEYTVRFDYVLSYRWTKIEGDKVTPIEGYIIQKIQEWEVQQRCPRNGDFPSGDLPTDPPTTTFWEAVPVTADGVNNVFRDRIHYPGGAPGMWGYFREFGEQKFFSREEVFGLAFATGDLSSDPAWGRGKVPQAGTNALSTYGPVSWWGRKALEGPGAQLTGVDYDCCGNCRYQNAFYHPGLPQEHN